ncbi:MAG: hypothetical protein JZU65_19030 [Chlorobium sp.]|nr:hypothetical protein [Chlorobium sp.]
MKTIAELIEFRRDLFFDGAVQIGWFGNDLPKRDKAATSFVFHGPKYHGVSTDDINETRGYRLTDTVAFSKTIIQSLGAQAGKDNPITLAIAGYGTGKSHLGLTLATLLSEPLSKVSQAILANIKNADPVLGAEIALELKEDQAPILVIPINGMGNFDLAAELSKQAITRLNAYGLDTAPIDELWPRFQQACLFVERNYELRQEEFLKRFGENSQKGEALDKLTTHDDLAFQWVNEIFEQANGYPIRAVGQESPQQLIQTLCNSYCGQGKPFRSMLILFDEFGRYLEFAAERPHIAGDAALQQIFEGVQDNGEKCALLCFNQYELKVYLSRISRERQSTIQRYITRYDSARKLYLSSNLETLFAHLIKKQDAQFISAYLSDFRNAQKLDDIQRWFPSAHKQSVWENKDLFGQVVVEGCWPLHPLATLFLSRSANFLQQRSAITFVAEAFDQAKDRPITLGEAPWTISATDLCDSLLIKELIAAEEYGQGGAIAQAYDTVTQKYEHDFSRTHRHTLLAVLIAAKLGLKVTSQQESHKALCALSGLLAEELQKSIDELGNEYGVLEWNERFVRYEILGDAVPRSTFISFLRHKVEGITAEQIEELFANYGKSWAGFNDIDPHFAADNNINTSEWSFMASCTHIGRLPQAINNAVDDWQRAVKPDELRGQVIYCYVRGDEKLAVVSNQIQKLFDESIEKANCGGKIPIFIILLHDSENKISRILAEYSTLSGTISAENKQKFSHFIDDHKNKSLEELKQICEEVIKQREYIVAHGLKIEKTRLNKVCYDIFRQVYPQIVPFPFDGFATTRGNAAKDCRLITAELLKGTLNHEWIVTQEPQAQNRAKNILKTWDSLGEDGEIRLHPRHQGLRKIITILEESIETEKVLNVGKLLHNLIAPPYGFNIASAGLVFGIFFASRKNFVVLVLDDQDISPSNWIGKAFSGNFLDFKLLASSTLRYVSGTETGEWQKLLSLWDNEQSHFGKVSFMAKADQLRTRVPLPPGELYERYVRLNEQTLKALEALRGLKSFLDNQYIYYEKSFGNQDAGNLSRIASDLCQRLETMRHNQTLWLEDQCAEIELAYTNAKQAVLQFFDGWLSQQSCLSSQQVGTFRHRMINQIGTNLKTIGIREKFNKLEDYTIKIIAQIEDREKIKFIIEDSQAFMNSHRVHSECRVAELRQWILGAEELISPLIKAGQQINAPEVKKTLSEIDILIANCKKQIKQHGNRVQALWNISILTKDDVHSTQREVALLSSLFSGDKPQNIDDLTTMQKQLDQFAQNLSLWADLNMSNQELEASVVKRINFELELQDDENEPVWEINETYNNILKSLLQEREEAASRWLSQLSFTANDIKEMDAKRCPIALGQLESRPVFLNAKQNLIVDGLENRIRERVNSLKLEGLLEMYNNLSLSLQKQFLSLVIRV